MNYHLVLCRNATLNKVKSVVRGRPSLLSKVSSLLRADLLLTARGTAYLPPEGRHVYRPWDGKFTARGAVSDEP